MNDAENLKTIGVELEEEMVGRGGVYMGVGEEMGR